MLYASMLGEVLGNYRVVEALDSGGMGSVYRAEHTHLGKLAAIKLLRPELTTNDEIVKRFFNEAKAATAIRHPGIIEVYDFGYTRDGQAYFVMELLDGEPLGKRLQRTGRFSEAEAAKVTKGIANVLKAAHAKGIVHRDLKPDNIFLVKTRDDERVKLLDFGIAKLAVEPTGGPRTSITQTGTVVGTPTHMSPEQAMGGSVGPASDIYALGVVAFELATGKLPFNAESSVQLMAKHLDEQPPMPRSIRPIGFPFERLILDMLSKKPSDRPTATDVRKRLVSLRDAPTDGATSIADQQQTMPGARAVAAKVRVGTAPTEILPSTGPEIRVEISAPSIPALALAASVPVLTPVPAGSGTSVSPDAPRSKWPWIGAAAAIVVGAVVVFAAIGGQDAPKASQPAAPVTAPAPEPAPSPVAVEPAPEPTPSAAVPATTAEPAGPRASTTETSKPTGGRKHRRPAAQSAQPSTSSAEVPPTPAAPKAEPPPEPPKQRGGHDVDAVHDPFSDGAKK